MIIKTPDIDVKALEEEVTNHLINVEDLSDEVDEDE